ncbi:MAG: hypothetical protein IKI04_01725 [Bacilli bacterium]|nr:hypothetical protein [Bacilli bacterium]
MKKKLLLIIPAVILLLVLAFVFIIPLLSGKDGITFKNDYEVLNGKENANGKVHREVTIPKQNPIIISDLGEVVKMIENGESFYVYFGDPLCPWCRSVIEKAIEVANANGIKKIYYVDFWDNEGNEVLRDKYTLDDNGNIVKDKEGTEEYNKIITYLADVLDEYTLTDKDGNKTAVGEKRVYLPNFIYIAKGKAVRITTGISSLQEGSRDELTEDILKEEEQKFDDFFINVCDDNC